MKTKYFSDCKTIEEAKRLYHKLAVKHHPDLGGDLEIMKIINNEYEYIAKKLANTHENAEGEQYTTEQNSTEAPAEFMNIINSIIHFDGVKIELVGRWVWVTGNTYLYKEQLKKLGFKYANTKKAWFWHSENETSCNRKSMSLDKIKEKYGCTSFQTNSRVCIA